MPKDFKVNVRLSYAEAEKLLNAFQDGKLPMVKSFAVTNPPVSRKVNKAKKVKR